MSDHRYLCCRLPAWPLQHRGQILASPYQVLYRVDQRRGRIVTEATRAARRLGVHRGMPLAEAESLLPQAAHFLPHDPRLDREELEQLAIWTHRFTPHVGIESPFPGTPADHFSPESLLADVTHSSRYFGSEWELLRQMARALAARRLQARLAIAHSIGAAWGLAHAGNITPIIAPPLRPHSPLPPMLADLPVTALRLPVALSHSLRMLGLETIELLAALPRAALKLRLDPLILKRLEQFLGIADESLPVVHAASTYDCSIDLESPVTSWLLLKPIWQQLASQLAAQLLADHRGALQLDVELTSPAGKLVRSLHFTQGSACPSRWYELWKLQQESLPDLRAITGLRLTASITARFPPRRAATLPSIDLETQDDSNSILSAQWSTTLDRIAARIGRHALFRPRLLAEPVPERAWCREPPTRRPPRLRPPRQPRHIPCGRPLQLLATPLPLAISTPTLPRQLTLPRPLFRHRAPRRIRRVWGPQQIDAGWRNGPPIHREYYHLETDDARRWWIYYSLDEQRWYLHGWDG